VPWDDLHEGYPQVRIASTKRQQPSGRYGAPAPAPAGGLGTAPSLNIRTAIGAVDDPLERGKKLAATVNRNVDVLEWEYSHRQIDEAAYQAGRLLKRAYERVPGAANGSNWRGGDRLDPITARSLKEDRHIDAMKEIERLERLAATEVGWSGVALLRLVLRDGLKFKDITLRAAAKGSRASVPQVADRFRWALAEAADPIRAAKGQDR
jgi:hypothetical protein